jgi:CRISPR-associated exonuclease Cas4
MINFNDEINEFLKRKQESDAHEMVVGKYSPSLLPACLRRQYFEYKHPIPASPEKLKIFALGNSIHEQIAHILSESKNIKTHSEERSLTLMHPDYEGIIISGRLDNFIVLKDGGKNVIVEVKSAKTLQTYDQPNHTWVDMTAPKKEHVMQLNCYLYALPNSVGLVLYVNKTTFETKQFEVQPNKALLVETLERARKLHDHLTTDTFPEAEAKMNEDTTWNCKYCEFAPLCDKMPKQAVKDRAPKLADTTTENFLG